jgi:flagellar protein FlaE
MAIDPRNYDVDELRSATGRESLLSSEFGERTEAEDADRRHPAAAAFEQAVTRDVVELDREAGERERPYLTALPPSLVAEALVFEWLEYLVLQAGRESVPDALWYYAAIGWVSEDVAADLETYLSGIDAAGATPENDLDADDHRISLDYVARLATLTR